jgi:eukaryotic-like serine/threonine-protein kinase
MSVATLAALVELIRRYHLLDPAHLQALDPLQAHFPEPRALARELVQRDWLTPFQVNQLFLGRGHELELGGYVLLEKLGDGGMGRVYKALNRKLGRVVALKVLQREHLQSGEAARRFRREILATAQLDHPNVVRAHDAEEFGGSLCLVMEYVEGTDLGKLVKRQGPLPVASACSYARQAALALQHAHEKGVVHRDVKPSNLLLTADGKEVKVLDLGLALLRRDSGSGTCMNLTVAGHLLGTADFLPPEQGTDARTVDGRADLYSLGCTLYYLLTGRVPFPGGSFVEKAIHHRLDEPTPLERLRPDVPPDVVAVVRKLMAKRPEDRYPTAWDAAAALARVPAPPKRTTATMNENPFAALTDDTSAGSAARAEDAGPAGPRRRRAASGCGLLLLLLVGLGVLAFRPWTWTGGGAGARAAVTPGDTAEARLRQR